MLTPILKLGVKSTGAWKHLTENNNTCPGCGKTIYRYNTDIEYSSTKRGTHVFWHAGCTGKVWH